jgi:hypothetical protein
MHGRYAAWLSCGNVGTGIAGPGTPEKGPVANKKHLELGCGVPLVASLVRKDGMQQELLRMAQGMRSVS